MGRVRPVGSTIQERAALGWVRGASARETNTDRQIQKKFPWLGWASRDGSLAAMAKAEQNINISGAVSCRSRTLTGKQGRRACTERWEMPQCMGSYPRVPSCISRAHESQTSERRWLLTLGFCRPAPVVAIDKRWDGSMSPRHMLCRGDCLLGSFPRRGILVSHY